MSDIFLFIGLGVFIFGGVAFLISAFKTSLLWGVGCLLITPVTIFYLFMHWGDAKKPFIILLSGSAIMLVGSYMQGSVVL